MKSDDLAIFSHSPANKSLVFLLNGISIYFYSRFVSIAKGNLYEVILFAEKGMDYSETFLIFLKVVYFSGIFVGLFIVILLMATLVDIWGLKVIVAADSVTVMNSLMPFPGTGVMDGEEIVEIQKGWFRFYLVGKTHKLSFSGVEKIEKLFHLISECKKNTKNPDNL